MSKRTVLITGCSDGSLGSQFAIAFHKAGWRTFATARNMSKLKLVQQAGIETIQLDTLDEESIKNAVAEVERLTAGSGRGKSGSLDMLVNNAGAGYSMPVMDIDIARARDLMDLNVFSLISMTRAFFPLLQNGTNPTIANNTSCSGLVPGAIPFAGAYNLSKGAAVILTETLRLELEPFGIKVVNIVTGMVKSTFQANKTSEETLPPNSIYNIAKETIEKFMAGSNQNVDGADPEKYAAGVVAALTKNKPSHWIWRGAYATITRISYVLPIGATDFITKKMAGINVLAQKVQEQKAKKA